jgi:DNA invertase Pin-like site-specific DNA recombinase
MNGQNVGYVRVSSPGQNVDRQLDGQVLDRVFEEKASGKNVQRPAYEECMQYLRQGDTLVVHSMDRLARNLDDLRRTVQTLTARGVQVRFFKEGLVFSGDDSPMATLLLSVMGAFAEFERALIHERQMEGIALAKLRGAYKGRKRALTDSQLGEVRKRIASGEKKTRIARDVGVSRQTLHEYLRTRCPSTALSDTRGGAPNKTERGEESVTTTLLSMVGR